MQGDISITMESEPKPSESPKKLRKILPRPRTPQIVIINSSANDRAPPKLRSVVPQNCPPPLVTNTIQPKDLSSNRTLPPLTVINQQGMKINVVKAVWVPNAPAPSNSTIQGDATNTKENILPKIVRVASVPEKELCCRLCGRTFASNTSLVDIYSTEGKTAELREKVCRCIPITIKPSDKLPTTVCRDCIKVLDLSFKLIVSALKTDQHLRNRLLSEESRKGAKWLTVEINQPDNTTHDNSFNADADKSDFHPGHPNFDHTYNMRVNRKGSEKTTDSPTETGPGVNGESRYHLSAETVNNIGGYLEHVENDHGVASSSVRTEKGHRHVIAPEENDLENSFSDVSLMSCMKCKEICLDDEDLQFHLNHECVVCDVCNLENRSRRAYVLHLKKQHGTTVAEVLQGGDKLAILKEAACNGTEDVKRKTAAEGGNLIDQIENDLASSTLENGHYNCPTCGRIYRKLANFKNHCLLHEPLRIEKEKETENIFVCDKCPSSYNRISSLVQHQRSHDLNCQYCSANFKSRKDRLNHEKEKHSVDFQESMMKTSGITKPKGGRLWICSYCERPLSSKLALSEHERIHTGAKPCTCEYCGRSFRTKTNLSQHIAVHTRERTHLCSICGKGFSRKSFVRQHMRIHTGEKPFVCELCGKQFTQAGDLGRHRRKHGSLNSLGESAEKKRRLEVVTADTADPPADPEAAQSEDMIAASSISGITEEVVYTAQCECEFCFAEFDDIDGLRDHLLEAHDQEYQDVEELVEDHHPEVERELSEDDKEITQYVLVVPS